MAATRELTPAQRVQLGKALYYLLSLAADDPPAEAEPARGDDDKNYQSGQRDDC